MEREQILNMKPGRELDALVEQYVFGNQVEWVQGDITDPYPIVPAEYGYIVETYSTDLSAAWEVVEKMRETHVYEIADFGRNKYKNTQHYAAFHPITKPRNYERQVHAKTLPEAICKAALLAMVVSPNE